MPGVVVATEPFVTLARLRASVSGIDRLPILVLPHPFETLSEEEIRIIARDRVDELADLILEALGK